MRPLSPPPFNIRDLNSTAWQYWFKLLYDSLSKDSDVLEFKTLALTTLGARDSYTLHYCHKVNSVSRDYGMAGEESILFVDATAANRTITLPAARIAGGQWTFPLTIRRIDASGNTVTVAAKTGDTVDGAASVTIAANRSRILVSDSATRWYTVGVN